jgi:hypothetical protein
MDMIFSPFLPAYDFNDFVKAHRKDGFVCRGVLLDAHIGRAPLAPTMQGAQIQW